MQAAETGGAYLLPGSADGNYSASRRSVCWPGRAVCCRMGSWPRSGRRSSATGCCTSPPPHPRQPAPADLRHLATAFNRLTSKPLATHRWTLENPITASGPRAARPKSHLPPNSYPSTTPHPAIATARLVVCACAVHITDDNAGIALHSDLHHFSLGSRGVVGSQAAKPSELLTAAT